MAVEMKPARVADALGREGWPRWMTTATCARYIDRTESAIRHLVERGAIPFVKQGDRVYFDRFVIDAWMAGRTKPTARPTGRLEPPD